MKFIVLFLFSFCVVAHADMAFTVFLPDGSKAKQTEVFLHRGGLYALDRTNITSTEPLSIRLVTNDQGVLTVPEKWYEIVTLQDGKKTTSLGLGIVIDVKNCTYLVGVGGQEIRLKKAQYLKGRVLGQDGKPVKGATVRFTSIGFHSYTPTNFLFEAATTDVKGEYALRDITFLSLKNDSMGIVTVTKKEGDRKLSNYIIRHSRPMPNEKLIETTLYPVKTLKVKFRGASVPDMVYYSTRHESQTVWSLNKTQKGIFHLSYLEKKGEIVEIRTNVKRGEEGQLSFSYYLNLRELDKHGDTVAINTEALLPITVESKKVYSSFVSPVKKKILNERWSLYVDYPREYIRIKRKNGTSRISDDSFMIYIPDREQTLYLGRKKKVEITSTILKTKLIKREDLKSITKLDFYNAGREKIE